MEVSEKIKNGIDLTPQESFILANGFLKEPGITYVTVGYSTGVDLNIYQTVFYVDSVLYAISYHSRHGEAANFSQPYKVKKIQREHWIIETLYVPV